MSEVVLSMTESDHKGWEAYGLKDFGDYAECVEYVNQTEYGDGQLEGEWFYVDDALYIVEGQGQFRVIYHGTFGNYNSPGSSCHTHALLFDVPGQMAHFEAVKEEWEGMPEYDTMYDEEEEEEEDE